MGQHEENEKYFESRRGHDKEIDSDELFNMLVEKFPPSRRG